MSRTPPNVRLTPRRSNLIIGRPDAPTPIGDVLRGRTVEATLRTEEFLLIRCTDGVEIRIAWLDENGKRKGVPVVADVRTWK